MKNSLGRFKGRYEQAKEGIRELEDSIMEIMSEKPKEKKKNKSE